MLSQRWPRNATSAQTRNAGADLLTCRHPRRAGRSPRRCPARASAQPAPFSARVMIRMPRRGMSRPKPSASDLGRVKTPFREGAGFAARLSCNDGRRTAVLGGTSGRGARCAAMACLASNKLGVLTSRRSRPAQSFRPRAGHNGTRRG